jgi:two-component system, NtrC family, sensor kinase
MITTVSSGMRVLIHKGVAIGLLLVLCLIPPSLVIAITQRATWYSLPFLAAGTVMFLCAIRVLFVIPAVPLNRLCALGCAGLSLVGGALFMAYSSADAAAASIWHRLSYAGLIPVPAICFHLLAEWSKAIRRAWVYGVYGIGAAFLALLPTSLLLDGDAQFFWGYYPRAGMCHPLLLLYALILNAMMIGRLLVSVGSRTKDRTLMYALSGLVATNALWVDFIQSYGYEFYPAGYLACAAAVLMTSYAVVKRDAPGLSPALSAPNVLAYAQALSLLLLFYLVMLAVVRYFTDARSYELAATLLAMSTIFAGLLARIQKQMEAMVGKALFKEKHEGYETLREFSRAMVSILDLPTLTQTILGTLQRVLHIQHLSIFLLDGEKNLYLLSGASGPVSERVKSLRLSASDDLPYSLRCSQAIVVRNTLPSAPYSPESVPHVLDVLEAEVCLPLVNKDRLIGFINLGPRRDDRAYSDGELHFLTTLAHNAAVALDNAMLYTDLKRSQILMRRTDRLRSLETIAGGFAHEIRNPLTSIKTFVQLAPGRKHDDDFINQFGRVVMEDVYRIERLIHEILDYARYRDPKFLPEDLNEVVASCLYFIEVKASSKLVSVEKHLASDLPSIMLDRQQIKQVLLNLFLNAMDAMGESGGRLTVKTRRLHKPEHTWLQIEISDTGMGIAPGNLEHIFDPFYTTKHESGEREGTGLGLAIVHQIIQEHQGSIEVESAPGAGTAVYVNLRANPIGFELSKEPKDHEKTGVIG